VASIWFNGFRQKQPFKPKGEATDEKVYTKAWKVIQIDENQIQEHLGELVRGQWRRRSISYWMPKRINCAMQSDMRGPRGGEIPGRHYERKLQTKAERLS